MSDQQTLNLERVLAGGGELGALISKLDWSATPLGPIESWPPSLQTAVSICLYSRFPIHIWWGPEFVEIYNDAYRPILGVTKHPASLGKPGAVTSAEIWHIIGPMLRNVYDNAVSTWSDNLMLPMDRYGYTEETFFTLSYSPIFVETGKVGGIYTVVTETTRQVLGERRLKTLHRLSERASDAKTAEAACLRAGETLADNREDIPFALIYLLNEANTQARLVATSAIDTNSDLNPSIIDLTRSNAPWQLAEVLATGQSTCITNFTNQFKTLPPSPWEERPHTALVLPVHSTGGARITGFLIGGISARLELDEEYQHFYELIAGHIATAIANARAYEHERERAEALAELDRVKTAFFNNVSHEFRTPLTLILEPLNDLLNQEGLSAEQLETLTLIRRNSLRLLKLVNTLLDFSRIEAGRVDISFEPTDLAAYTTDLTSMFRAATDNAGLILVADCPPLPEPVYVDREMWEKIVLNLLSNAFKFTFEGKIEVTLRADNDFIELKVRDTGVGIPAHELPHIFDRFHRVRGARSRTNEGTGIGLALVRDLVQLHQGKIEVESAVNQGTVFTVSIRRGHAHLPPGRIQAKRNVASTAVGAMSYVEEALRWLPDAPQPAMLDLQIIAQSENGQLPQRSFPLKPDSARVLLVDDNADMREYLSRLLSAHFTVEAYPDGFMALEAAQKHLPDLILADVMMPGLDGFELLRALRSHPSTQGVPIILLSARAGEEATVEGLEAGADAYLVKPFSARELLAQVTAQLQMTRLRRAELRIKQQEAELAVLEERQRISRELHDAVNQLLFSASIIAESLPRVWERDPNKVLPSLAQLARLTRGAGAEMRTLLMELRPAALENAQLSQLFGQLVEVTLGRTSLDISLVIDDEEASPLPLDVRLTFYRIAQEALNNVVKHAQARRVDVFFSRQSGQAEMRIRDNGRGFQRVTPSTGIGLESMAERAQIINATFEMNSELGQGTEIVVRWMAVDSA